MSDDAKERERALAEAGRGYMVEPCPWCGGAADFWIDPAINSPKSSVTIFRVRCHACGATSHGEGSQGKLLAAWNKLALAAEAPAPGREGA
jgi:Lar family restriction alleviation protein